MPSWRENDLLVAAPRCAAAARPLRRVGDVHVLDADIAAIGALQDVEDLAERAVSRPEHEIEEDRTVEVALGEAVAARIELVASSWSRGARPRDRGSPIEVAAHPIGADHQ